MTECNTRLPLLATFFHLCVSGSALPRGIPPLVDAAHAFVKVPVLVIGYARPHSIMVLDTETLAAVDAKICPRVAPARLFPNQGCHSVLGASWSTEHTLHLVPSGRATPKPFPQSLPKCKIFDVLQLRQRSHLFALCTMEGFAVVDQVASTVHWNKTMGRPFSVVERNDGKLLLASSTGLSVFDVNTLTIVECTKVPFEKSARLLILQDKRLCVLEQGSNELHFYPSASNIVSHQPFTKMRICESAVSVAQLPNGNLAVCSLTKSFVEVFLLPPPRPILLNGDGGASMEIVAVDGILVNRIDGHGWPVMVQVMPHWDAAWRVV